MNISAIYRQDLSPELEDSIASLLSEYFRTERSNLWKLRFNLMWHSNPYLADGVPAGWILKNDDDEICGFLGNIPVEFQYGYSVLKASGITSLYVQKQYAGIESSRLCLSFMKQKTDILIDSTPNDTAEKIFSKLKFRKIPVDNITSYIIVQMPCLFLKYIFDTYIWRSDRKITPIQLKRSKTVSMGVLTSTKCMSDVQNTEEFTVSEYTIKRIPSVSEFANCLNRHPLDDRIMLSRTSESLNWILFSPEVQILLHRSVISIWDHAKNYLGYCIFDLKEENASQRYLLVREIELLEFDVIVIKVLKKYLKVVAKQNSCFMIQIRLIKPNLQLDQMLSKVILLKKEGVNNYLVNLSKNLDFSLDEYRASALDPDLGFV